MTNNKKLLIYGSLTVVLLIVIIAIFFTSLFGDNDGDHSKGANYGVHSLYRAVPSDAVAIFDFADADNFIPMLNDTSSFAYGIVDEKHPISRVQSRLAELFPQQSIPLLFSLHYSSKNDVSILALSDLAVVNADGKKVNELLPFLQGRKKKYNSTDIYKFSDTLNVALCDGILVMSTSSFLVESVIRHLDNGTSILDNVGFASLHAEQGGKKALYINHHQIGKFFSGVVVRQFLRYSDFILKYASWSCFEIKFEKGALMLDGVLENEREEKYQSTGLVSQENGKSEMGKILPAQTLFCTSILLSDVQSYLDAHQLFLEVHKKLSGYKYKQHVVGVEGRMSPLEYADSLGVKELVSAYCKFGDRHEWLTFIRGEASFGIGDMVASVIDKKKIPEVKNYIYKGYLESVFGEVFSHCNEESICDLGGGWHIIGPMDILSEFALGNANYTTFDYWFGQTPLKNFTGSPGVVKVFANIKESPDSILQVVKPYYRGLFAESTKCNNFEAAALNIGVEGADVVAQVEFYATRLSQMPQERTREESVDNTIYIDSTIVVERGPFEIRDHVKGGKQYVEQLPNNKIRLMSDKKKGIWSIPFDSPICGVIDQVDFFRNGKLQMIFVSGEKLYLLDRMARIVRGFPVKLENSVLLGPKVVDIDKEYMFFVLNEDNSVSLYKLERDKNLKGVHIKAPEFVKELPDLRAINGKNYIFLKTVFRTRIYDMEGKEIEVKDKKRVIGNDSAVTIEGGDDIRVTGKDGKDFIVNLKTGKTRKIQ